MKWLYLLMLLAWEGQLCAQGNVEFNTFPNRMLNELTGMRVTLEDGILAGLFYAPDGITDETQFIQLGSPARVGLATPGDIAAGLRITPETTQNRQPAMFQIRAWEAAYGSTFDEAINAGEQNGRRALAGKSNIVRIVTDFLHPPFIEPLDPLSVQVVPEPDILVLLVLGTLAAIWRSHRSIHCKSCLAPHEQDTNNPENHRKWL